MPKRLNSFQIFLEVIILILFIKPMFNINYFTGLFYVLAIGIAFWKKLIFKRKNIAWMIIFGTILSYISGLFIPHIVGNYIAGDIISAMIIFLIAFWIWRKSSRLKKGKK